MNISFRLAKSLWVIQYPAPSGKHILLFAVVQSLSMQCKGKAEFLNAFQVEYGEGSVQVYAITYTEMWVCAGINRVGKIPQFTHNINTHAPAPEDVSIPTTVGLLSLEVRRPIKAAKGLTEAAAAVAGVDD